MSLLKVKGEHIFLRLNTHYQFRQHISDLDLWQWIIVSWMLKCLQLSNCWANLYIKISLREAQPFIWNNCNSNNVTYALKVLSNCLHFFALNKCGEEWHYLLTGIPGWNKIRATVRVGKSLVKWGLFNPYGKYMTFFFKT